MGAVGKAGVGGAAGLGVGVVAVACSRGRRGARLMADLQDQVQRGRPQPQHLAWRRHPLARGPRAMFLSNVELCSFPMSSYVPFPAYSCA